MLFAPFWLSFISLCIQSLPFDPFVTLVISESSLVFEFTSFWDHRMSAVVLGLPSQTSARGPKSSEPALWHGPGSPVIQARRLSGSITEQDEQVWSSKTQRDSEPMTKMYQVTSLFAARARGVWDTTGTVPQRVDSMSTLHGQRVIIPGRTPKSSRTPARMVSIGWAWFQYAAQQQTLDPLKILLVSCHVTLIPWKTLHTNSCETWTSWTCTGVVLRTEIQARKTYQRSKMSRIWPSCSVFSRSSFSINFCFWESRLRSLQSYTKLRSQRDSRYFEIFLLLFLRSVRWRSNMLNKHLYWGPGRIAHINLNLQWPSKRGKGTLDDLMPFTAQEHDRSPLWSPAKWDSASIVGS